MGPRLESIRAMGRKDARPYTWSALGALGGAGIGAITGKAPGAIIGGGLGALSGMLAGRIASSRTPKRAIGATEKATNNAFMGANIGALSLGALGAILGMRHSPDRGISMGIGGATLGGLAGYGAGRFIVGKKGVRDSLVSKYGNYQKYRNSIAI